VAGSFNGPVAVAGIPGDASRLLVAEKAGRVRMVIDGVATPTAFLDISPMVTSDGERGLLGVAAAPDYASSGNFYVYYTDPEGDIRIDEFHRSADPNVADASTRRPVLEVPHPSASNHNGGTVMFGQTAAYGPLPGTAVVATTSSTKRRTSRRSLASCYESIRIRQDSGDPHAASRRLPRKNRRGVLHRTHIRLPR
jgi:hypothetical protein